MKELIRSVEKGVGFGIGLVIVASLFLGVYAFVEPSAGPSADYYFDGNSSIISNNTLQYVGLTSSVDGNQGNWANVIDLCDSTYPGSRPATIGDIYRLGNNYPYSTTVWVFPEPTQAFPGSTNCYGFDDTLGTGRIMASTGEIASNSCAATRAFACVKGS